MARYIDESKLIQAIIKERDKIPQTIPCASYELLDEKPNSVGQSQRAGIRKALRCIAEAPTADVVEVVRCKECSHRNPCGHKCLRDNLWHDDDDFCSYGERRVTEDVN